MNNAVELKTDAPLGELKRFWLDAQKNGDTFTSNDDFVQRYISYRNKKEMNEIKAEFSAQFGSEGESIAAEPAFSEKLNGGFYSYDDEKAENPYQYFIGMPYSLPLIVYMMRRSLDTPEDIAFKKYAQSVHNMADELKEPLYSLPTRSFIEELTAPYLVRIQLQGIVNFCHQQPFYHDYTDNLINNNISLDRATQETEAIAMGMLNLLYNPHLEPEIRKSIAHSIILRLKFGFEMGTSSENHDVHIHHEELDFQIPVNVNDAINNIIRNTKSAYKEYSDSKQYSDLKTTLEVNI